jgi:hypothetical protein
MFIADIATHTPEHIYKLDTAPVYCDLFSDRVADCVCLLLEKD